MTRPRLRVPLALLGLLPLLCTPAHADTRNEVVLGGVLVHTIRTPWVGLSPEQRANQVQERLNMILSRGPVHPKDITVGLMQGDWCVLYRGQRFLTADTATARQDDSQPEALAQMWAARMRRILPPLTTDKGK